MKKLILIFSILITIFLVGCSNIPEEQPNNQNEQPDYSNEQLGVPGEYDEFAQCLTEKGVKMYGTEWCSHCKNQKAMFGTSFQYVDYIDCDKNKNACSSAGVTGYPTWKVGGNNYPGEKQLNILASLSGCTLPE
jgi:hypothetical protein